MAAGPVGRSIHGSGLGPGFATRRRRVLALAHAALRAACVAAHHFLVAHPWVPARSSRPAEARHGASATVAPPGRPADPRSYARGPPTARPAYTARMPTLRHALAAGGLGLALIWTAADAPAQTGDALYVCADPGDTHTIDIGATICDAAPTGALTERLEPDNLQLREGALVTEVSPGGIAQVAGLQAGDVIYRVGGVDVEDNVEATARLGLLVESADTVVNFLRAGRPYLVRLRRP